MIKIQSLRLRRFINEYKLIASKVSVIHSTLSSYIDLNDQISRATSQIIVQVSDDPYQKRQSFIG